MTERVATATALELTTKFYQRLRDHGEPDRALVEATASLAEQSAVAVPVLFSSLGGRPLFSDALDRALTAAEIEFGLTSLVALVDARAPVLRKELVEASAIARQTAQGEPGRLSAAADREQRTAMAQIETICGEATELSFQALALGNAVSAYDVRCPFPGLRAFQAELRAFFFGREQLVGQLQKRLGEQPFLAVVGPSGSGKSSLVFAGLLPALQARAPELQLVTLTPGDHPRAALAAALAPLGAEAQAVLVIDQFEEAFTLCTDGEERKGFFEELLRLPSRMPTVITMRADFFDELAPYARLREAVQAQQELVTPLSPEELRRVIELQAAAVGLRFEADLSGQILDDVRDEPGAMPLLQHALQELWQRRRGRWLRSLEYRAIGGIQQAIAFTADAIYARSAPSEQERLRAIFVRLTRLDREEAEQRRDTRQRVVFSELVPASADPAPVRALVDRLADARLLVTGISPTGQEMVEVAHEALIRGWPRLRIWLIEDRGALLLREAIGQAARDWEQAGHDEGYLLRGGRLGEALALGERPRFALNDPERRFVDAGAALGQREAAEREQARQRELDQARALASEQQQRADEARASAIKLRRRALIAAGIAVAAVAAAIAALVFWSIAGEQRALADANAHEAAQRAIVADAGAALARGENDKALALALTAVERGNPQPQAYFVLAEAADAGARRRFGFDAPVFAAAFSPDGALMIAGDDTGNVRAWDPASGVEQRSVRASGGVRAFAFLPDRSGIVIATDRGTLEILDAVGGRSFAGGNGEPISALALSPDGATAFTGSLDGSVLRWDVGAQRFDTLLFALAGVKVSGLSVDESGALIALFNDGTLREIDPLAGGERAQATLTYSDGPDTLLCIGTTMRYHPLLGTHRLYVGCENGLIQIWSLANGVGAASLYYTYFGHDGEVLSIDFAPDGQSFVSSSLDLSIRLWDGEWGVVLAVFRGHKGEANQVAFDPLGRSVLTAGFDRSVRQWDVRGGQRLRDYTPPDMPRVATTARLSADGERLVALVGDQAYVWSIADGSEQARMQLTFEQFALSPDGSRALIRDDELNLIVWDLERNTEVTRLRDAPDSAIINAAFSPDRSLVLVAFDKGVPQLYNAVDGSLIRRFEQDKDANVSWSLAFSPDGTLAIAGTSDIDIPAARVWDVASGQIRARLVGHQDVVTAVAFSADGTKAITGSWDRSVKLWDLASQSVERSFEGHTRTVRSVELSPDGRLLLSGGDDRAIILWDVASATELARYAENDGLILSVGFGPGGHTAFSSSSSGDVLLWRVLSRDELVVWVRENRYLASLSCEEQARYRLPCADGAP